MLVFVTSTENKTHTPFFLLCTNGPCNIGDYQSRNSEWLVSIAQAQSLTSVISLLALKLALNQNKTMDTMEFVCEMCGKAFKLKKYLNAHLKNTHKSKCEGNYKCVEEHCECSFRRNIDFVEHLKTKHFYDIDIEEKKCSSLQSK